LRKSGDTYSPLPKEIKAKDKKREGSNTSAKPKEDQTKNMSISGLLSGASSRRPKFMTKNRKKNQRDSTPDSKFY
jgi:hypothetical protein